LLRKRDTWYNIFEKWSPGYPLTMSSLLTLVETSVLGGFLLMLTFLNVSRRCAILRDNKQNSFKILRIEITSSWQWEYIESNLHGYRSVWYTIIRRNKAICTVISDKQFWMNLVIWGRFYGVIYEWQADFWNVTRGA
jgi:hypothetical protein